MCKRRRVASIRAESYCNVFTLSAEHFAVILDHHPDMKRTMEYVARERLQNLAAATSPSNVGEQEAMDRAASAKNRCDARNESERTETRCRSGVPDVATVETEVEFLSPDDNEKTMSRERELGTGSCRAADTSRNYDIV